MASKEEIRRWYNERHRSKGEHAWAPSNTYDVFLDNLGVTAPGKILDIACGTGYLLRAASDRGLQTFGIDLSEEAVAISQKTSPQSQIVVGEGENIPFPDQSFDYITCIGSLEHFSDIKKGVQEMARVGKDNARYCIVVPNSEFLVWKLLGQKGTEQQQIKEALMSKAEWVKTLHDGGLTVVATYQDKHPMHQVHVFQSWNPVRIVKKIVLKLVWMFLPLEYCYQFIFILKKN